MTSTIPVRGSAGPLGNAESFTLDVFGTDSSEDRWTADLDTAVGETLPVAVDSAKAITQAIRESQSIARLRRGWDGDDATGYDQATLDRATTFLWNLAATSSGLPVPLISPADAGSIDLYWRLDDRTLLVNFPTGDREGSFFGKDRDRGTISGKLKGSGARPDLVAWLVRP